MGNKRQRGADHDQDVDEGVVDNIHWKRYGRVVKIVGTKIVVGLKKQQMQAIANLDINELVQTTFKEHMRAEGGGASQEGALFAVVAHLTSACPCVCVREALMLLWFVCVFVGSSCANDQETSSYVASCDDHDELSKRVSVQPDRFDPFTELTAREQARLCGRGDGERRRVLAAHTCNKPGCVSARAERDRLRSKRQADAQVLRGLSDKLDLCCKGFESHEVIVIEHLQQALMELLDEEMVDQDNNAEVESGEGCSNRLESSSDDESETNVDTEQMQASVAAKYDGKQGLLALCRGGLRWFESTAIY